MKGAAGVSGDTIPLWETRLCDWDFTRRWLLLCTKQMPDVLTETRLICGIVPLLPFVIQPVAPPKGGGNIIQGRYLNG